jgi:hypothetical protein
LWAQKQKVKKYQYAQRKQHAFHAW